MAYIGNRLADSFTSFAKQDFTTSATTSYTLDNPVANENEIALFINFVRQEPTTAYTASGTSLTLTSATSASDDMYCVFLGKALQTVNPPSGSVGLDQLSATGTKDSTTFLRGDNTFQTIGTNTPAFEAKSSSIQTLSSNTNTLIQFDTVNFDTDNAYDNTTNYRFTPQVAGKYFVYTLCINDTGANSNYISSVTKIEKNGSAIATHSLNNRANYPERVPVYLSVVADMNGTTDYLSIEVSINDSSGSPDVNAESYFGAYKLIGV